MDRFIVVLVDFDVDRVEIGGVGGAGFPHEGQGGGACHRMIEKAASVHRLMSIQRRSPAVWGFVSMTSRSLRDALPVRRLRCIFQGRRNRRPAACSARWL